MTNVVKSYAVLYMGMEVIICQSEMSPERLMISQSPSIGIPPIKSAQVGEGMWRKPPTFEVTCTKPFLLKIRYSKLPKIVEFCTFYMSVFVNMINMVVNSDTDSTCAQKL